MASYFIAGWPGVVVGFFWSTVLLWHGTFTVNSLAHVMGRRRYITTDTSRNSALIAAVTGGEGWHNNHHYYQASARNCFFWWEYDPTYYALKVLSWFRIVRDLKVPPARVLEGARVREGSFDVGMFKAHWGKATAALSAHSRKADAAAPVDADVELDAATRSEAIAEQIHASREALEESVRVAMRSAEELAQLSRRHRSMTRAD